MTRNGSIPRRCVDSRRWSARSPARGHDASVRSGRRSSPDTGSAGRLRFPRLAQKKLVEIVCLRPLGTVEVTKLVEQAVRRTTVPSLLGQLRRLTRNWPKALTTTLDAYQRTDAIRVVDQHPYLRDAGAVPTLPADHELPRHIGRMGQPTWSVAKAMAVLNPLGAVAPRLVAEATGHPETDVTASLELLQSHGILRFSPRRSRWSFLLPLVEKVLIGQLGPYERRVLAKTAVDAIWSNRARCDAPDYLADQLANAGRLVDPGPAAQALLTRAAEEAADTRARQWLRAAAALTTDRGQRAEILLRQAVTCRSQGRFAEQLDTTGILLREPADQLPAELVLEIHLAHVSALHAAGDLASTEQIANGEPPPLPGSPAQGVVIRAAALYLLGRWRQVRELLADPEQSWRESAQARFHATLYGSLAGLWLGEREQFDRCLATLPHWRHSERQRHQQITQFAAALLTTGELAAARRLLADNPAPAQEWGPAERALLATHGTEFGTALELTRLSLVAAPTFGHGPSQTAGVARSAQLLLACGRIARGRDLLAAAVRARPVLGHLLAPAQAWITAILGEADQARDILEAALADVADTGTLVGTDQLRYAAVRAALLTGDVAALRRHQTEADRVARQLDTAQARLGSLLIRAIVQPRGDAGERALRLARHADQPHDLAVVIDHLVRAGAADPRLLAEAYEALGAVDALLLRCWMRPLMSRHDVPVPGRRAAVAENERLLAVLVAEGMSNKQMATILRVSERSVVGRLSRLFARAGHRSRVELAVAFLNENAEL